LINSNFFIEDICHGTDSEIGQEEVLSMFMSNFEGEEIVKFREVQKDGMVRR